MTDYRTLNANIEAVLMKLVDMPASPTTAELRGSTKAIEKYVREMETKQFQVKEATARIVHQIRLVEDGVRNEMQRKIDAEELAVFREAQNAMLRGTGYKVMTGDVENKALEIVENFRRFRDAQS